MHRGSLADHALHVNVSTHQRNKPADYDQAQSRALIRPGVGAVHLGEELEQVLELVGRDTDAGIGNGKHDPCVSPLGRGKSAQMDLDGPLVRELQGVAHQIKQD